jgi:hypothetical protein
MGNVAQAENGIGYTGTPKALHWLIVAHFVMMEHLLDNLRRSLVGQVLRCRLPVDQSSIAVPLVG